eukprot:snap_masked-scaffold_12-processed-gene-8.26-mRNA-1 protein AED:1.00 eAED:1.00 QI:0/0/0/0/1/1/2/0/98
MDNLANHIQTYNLSFKIKNYNSSAFISQQTNIVNNANVIKKLSQKRLTSLELRRFFKPLTDDEKQDPYYQGTSLEAFLQFFLSFGHNLLSVSFSVTPK